MKIPAFLTLKDRIQDKIRGVEPHQNVLMLFKESESDGSIEVAAKADNSR